MCQGREDDNIETMQKRLKVFSDYSVPAMKYYESMGKVHKVLPLPSTSPHLIKYLTEW